MRAHSIDAKQSRLSRSLVKEAWRQCIDDQGGLSNRHGRAWYDIDDTNRASPIEIGVLWALEDASRPGWQRREMKPRGQRSGHCEIVRQKVPGSMGNQ
jgi:hypothetical protein